MSLTVLFLILVIVTILFVSSRPNSYAERIKRIEEKPVTNNGELATKMYKLHLIYYDGMPDRYDLSGNKIKGVEPNRRLAIGYLESACRISDHPSLWMKLAGIHHHGMYGYEPNLELACDYYAEIANRFGLQAALIEHRNAMEEINTIGVHKWLNLPYKVKNRHHDRILRTLRTNKVKSARPVGGAGLGFGPGLVVEEIFRDDVRRNDTQNTHNTHVVATVAASLRKLKEVTDLIYDPSEVVGQVRRYLQSQQDCDKKRDAIRSLDAIESNILPITSAGMREVEALHLVWNRIHSTDLETNRDDLKETLYSQLADMQSHGSTVCPTGRLERIVDTLSAVDPNVAIKTTYIIKEEMMSKAHKIQQSIIEEYGNIHGENRKRMLEMGTAPDQDMMDQRVKTEIRSGLSRDYVDSGILSPEKFSASVDGWIDAL